MATSPTHLARRRAERKLTQLHPELFDPIHRSERETLGLNPDPLGPAECGTRSGYEAHRRRGETACDNCKESAAAYQRDRKAQSVAAA